MEKIRGRSLQEWKEYCNSENVPVKTMKYIICLEERIAAISVTRCCTEFSCYLEDSEQSSRCKEQCSDCKEYKGECN